MSLHFLTFPEKEKGTGLVLLQPRNFLTANILYPLHPPLLVFRLSLPRSRFLPPHLPSLQEPEKQKLPPLFPFFSVRPPFGLSREGENNETKEGGAKRERRWRGDLLLLRLLLLPLSLSIRLEVLCASANNSPLPPVAKAFPCFACPSLRKGRDGGLRPSFSFVPPSFRYPKTAAALQKTAHGTNSSAFLFSFSPAVKWIFRSSSSSSFGGGNPSKHRPQPRRLCFLLPPFVSRFCLPWGNICCPLCPPLLSSLFKSVVAWKSPNIVAWIESD